MLWGFHMGATNFKTANPLFFWSYHDETTNREEKLNRLWSLCNSSFEHSPLGCSICMFSDVIAPDPKPNEDVMVMSEIRPERQIVAPRKHFTNFDSLPQRDRLKLTAALLAEVQRLLGSNGKLSVEKTRNKQGHINFEITFNALAPNGAT